MDISSVQVIDIAQSYSDRIIHETKVDFSKRIIISEISLMQYDDNLPIIAVTLYKNGAIYQLPQDAQVYIRWGKRDHTYVRKNVLGCDENRQIIYFEVDKNMSCIAGHITPILELIIGENTAGSSYIYINIDRNPIQNGDIVSEYEDTLIEELIDTVREYEEALYNNYEVGEVGQTVPSDRLVVGGIFYENLSQEEQ